MALSLNAPIEELKLSNRVRNVLHLGGLHTLGSLLECDPKTVLRRFGPLARMEVACALEANGFAAPAGLSPPEQISPHVSKLPEQMDAGLQKWAVQIEPFELRALALTVRKSKRRRPAAAFTEQIFPAGLAALANEFGTCILAVHTAATALRQVTTLPPEQQELLTLVEEESVRLSLLACRVFGGGGDRGACRE